MPTLTQYWSDEVTRIGSALIAAQGELSLLRGAVLSAEATQRTTANLVRSNGDAVAAARRGLAAIPMPADGDPLLATMEAALVALHTAQATLAEGQRELLVLRARLQDAEATVQRLTAELAGAQATLDRETQAAAARQALADRFGAGGSLANLLPDAQAALAAHQATAADRVEGEFPTSATAAEDFLGRVRERARLVRDIAASAADVERPAYTAANTALAVAQRDFDAAVAALQTTADAGAQVAADIATLARLAVLPAPHPPDSYPVLTRWQHDLLHDPGRQAQREATLALLTAVDDARRAVIPFQVAYDQALAAAMKAEPDKTVAQLDATTLSAQRGALDAALGQVDIARNAYAAADPADRTLLDEWFAAVPDALWEALDALDGAVGRLEKLTGSPTPGDLAAAMDAAEVTLEAALRAAREAGRQTQGGQRAVQRATARLGAERDTVAARASAMARSGTLF